MKRHVRSTPLGAPAFEARTYCGETPNVEDILASWLDQYPRKLLCDKCSAAYDAALAGRVP